MQKEFSRINRRLLVLMVIICATLLVSCKFNLNPTPEHQHTIVIDKAIAATCQTTGLTEGQHCSECGEIIVAQNVIAINAHSIAIDQEVPASCKNTGLTAGTHCSECGTTILAQQVINKKAHTEGEWITDKEPSETETGKKIQICSYCGEILREATIPTLSMLKYAVNSDKTSCTVTGIVSFVDTAIYIPEYISEYKVTGIGQSAFANQKQLTAIIIPETVVKIGAKAFYGCTGLTEITVPASVTSIGTQIFNGASNLSTVYYNSTYSSESNQFLSVSNITKIVFGGECVPNYILKSNSNVKEVEIKNGVTSIGLDAFCYCTNLTNIVIPDSIINIGSSAFEGCSKLTTDIIIPDGVTTILWDTFRYCSSVTNIVIPDGVTSIGNNSFSYCSGITSIVIPDSVIEIGDAFNNCNNLVSITFNGTVEQWNAISKNNNWKYKVPATEVICCDGTVTL